MTQLQDLNVEKIVPLPSPTEFQELLPISPELTNRVIQGREKIQRILDGKSQRMIIITGPCSIHDNEAALDYARRLAELSKRVNDRLLIVMRAYFEKPRTTIGWKGLLYDPKINGEADLINGHIQARKLLLEIGTLGIITGTEWLDPITPQYLADLISWGSIGARTCESQTHRHMASGLSMPIGFKNNTEGNIQRAVDGIVAAKNPHAFLGVNSKGQASIVYTNGNPYCHLILRGGRNPNYDELSTAKAEKILELSNVRCGILVDCSHGNSNKSYKLQYPVFRNVLKQRTNGNTKIAGIMLESNLLEGSQKLQGNLSYGVSITDECIGWEETEKIILEAYESLS